MASLIRRISKLRLTNSVGLNDNLTRKNGGKYWDHVTVNHLRPLNPGFLSDRRDYLKGVDKRPRFDYQDPCRSSNNRGRVMADAQEPKQTSFVDLRQACREGKVKEAIELMNQGVRADADCFLALFRLCGEMKSLENAKIVHDHFLRSTCRTYLKLNNHVLEMFGKCEGMVDARRVFDHMLDRDIDSWHLMINWYANNGLGYAGLEVFQQMMQSGMKPNDETFSAVLSACLCIGAVEEGFRHFDAMKKDYGIEPKLQHYLGALDVLCQPGHLAEALEYVEQLPFEPTAEVWERLWNFARIHGDMNLEENAEEMMAALDPSKANPKKLPAPPPKWLPATNMLEGKSRLAEFKYPVLYMDDEKYKDRKEEVYIPNTSLVYQDIDEEAKKKVLLYHATRVAIAYGLLHTPTRTTLKFINNFRLCSDCHSAIKVMSRITGRELIVRDRKRVHHFENGQCSCGDYW